MGVEWTNHYRPTDWLFIDADIALSRAKLRDSDVAGKHIFLAHLIKLPHIMLLQGMNLVDTVRRVFAILAQDR